LISKVIGIEKRDEVILPSYNSVIVPNIIKILGAKPIFVDIDPETYTINPELIELKISKKTKAIIATHIEGQPCDLRAILNVADEYNIKVIEDCAHACGAEYKGKRVGGIGHFGFFSFDVTKHINTFGGGMITTNEDRSAEEIRDILEKFNPPDKTKLIRGMLKANFISLFTSQIIFDIFTYPMILISSFLGKDIITTLFERKEVIEQLPQSYFVRYSNFQASIGLEQLKSLEKNNKKRTKYANILTKNLDEGIKRQKTVPNTKPVYHNYTIQIKKRDEFRKRLLNRFVDTQPTLMVSCSSLNEFKESSGKCPVSDELEREGLYIPVYPELKKEDIYYIAEILNEEFRRLDG
jgi:dTDP-4-amino-4,6-dideoxygalactose transaminase